MLSSCKSYARTTRVLCRFDIKQNQHWSCKGRNTLGPYTHCRIVISKQGVSKVGLQKRRHVQLWARNACRLLYC